MKVNTLPGKRFKAFATTRQGSIERLEKVLPNIDSAKTTIGKVVFIHMARMAVDVETNNAVIVKNVQILTKGGLIDNEVWGELETPSIGTRVVIGFIGGDAGFPFIMGYVFPYGYSKYQSNQTPVNSGSKVYTQKLLEDVDPKYYRRIFKSGTTLEVQADGTMIIETPSGSFLNIQESDGKIIIDASGDEIQLNGSSKSLVTHAELDTALQSLKTMINVHTHVTVTSLGTPTPPTPPVSVNISAAEATKVKTS